MPNGIYLGLGKVKIESVCLWTLWTGLSRMTTDEKFTEAFAAFGQLVEGIFKFQSVSWCFSSC